MRAYFHRLSASLLGCLNRAYERPRVEERAFYPMPDVELDLKTGQPVEPHSETVEHKHEWSEWTLVRSHWALVRGEQGTRSNLFFRRCSGCISQQSKWRMVDSPAPGDDFNAMAAKMECTPALALALNVVRDATLTPAQRAWVVDMLEQSQ